MNSPVIEPLEARIAPAALAITATPASKDEGNGNGNYLFHVTLTGDDNTRTDNITVNFGTVATTNSDPATNAVPGTDFDSTSGTLTFAPGQTAQDITVPIHGNTTVQQDRTFSVQLSSPAGPSASIATDTATATILDDDTLVSVNSSTTVTEGDTASGANQHHVDFQINLAKSLTHPVTVVYSTTDGTAKAGTDFTGSNHVSVVIPAGSTSTTVSVPIIGDTVPSADKSFTLTLNSASGATVDTSNQNGAGIILNDDLSVHLGNVSVNEGSQATTQALVPVLLSGAVPTGYELHLTYTTTAGTATAGSDYDTVTSDPAHPIVVAAGQQVGYLPVSIHGDAVGETNETFTVQLASASLVKTGATTTTGTVGITGGPGTVTIVDDDPHSVQVRVAPTVATIAEGDGAQNASFTAFLSSPLGRDVTVTYDYTDTLTSGSAAPVTGHNLTAVIHAGDTFANFNVPYTGDTTPGPDHNIVVKLTDATPSTVDAGFSVKLDPTAARQTATVKVLDDDIAVTITAPAATPEGNSGTKDFVFPVHLAAAADHDVTISYHTVDGTAVSTGAHKDFIGQASGTLVIPKGQTDGSIKVSVIGDTLASPAGDESFQVHISGVSGAAAPTTTDYTGTIQNDDGTTTVSIGNAAAAEGGKANFNVILDHGSEEDVTVTYQVAADSATAARYTATTAETQGTATLTIPAGQTQGTIAIPITTDTNTDPQASFTVTIQNPTHAALDTAHATGTGTILPANLPILSFTGNVAHAEGNAGDHFVETFHVTLSSVPTRDVTFTVSTVNGTAVGGADTSSGDFVALTNKTFTIPANTQTLDIPVTLNGNDVETADKTFQLQLSLSGDATADTATLGTKTATGTIINDENGFAISSAVTVKEGLAAQKFATFVVARAANDPLSATVSYTTRVGKVYQADGQTLDYDYGNASSSLGLADFVPTSGTLTFGPNESSKTISIPITNDERYEGDETFSVVLTNSTNAALSSTAHIGTVTITNDDPMPVVHVGSPVIVKEGDSGITNAVFTISLDRVSEKLLAGSTTAVATVKVSTDGLTSAMGVPLADKLVTFVSGGSLQQTVTVQINGNTAQSEPITEFRLNLSDAQGATLDPTMPYGIGRIVDDDPTPVVSVASASVNQGGAETFTVTLSNASVRPIQVFYHTVDGTAHSTGGTDFTGVAASAHQSIIFAAGETSKTISIPTTASNGIAGPNEQFSLVLDSATDVLSGAQKALPVTLNPKAKIATGTIVNTTPEFISINDVSVAEGDSGLKNVSFTVSLSAPSSVPVTVLYNTADGTATIAGADYVAKSGTVVIPATLDASAPHTQAQVTLQVRGDVFDEGDETFKVVLSGAKNGVIGRATGTATITNDDLTPTLSVEDAYIAEDSGGSGGTYLSFQPKLSRPATADVTFTIATGVAGGALRVATVGSDYTGATATFTIKAGDTTVVTTSTPTDGSDPVKTPVSFKVAITSDSIFELAESFGVKITDVHSTVPVIQGKTTAIGTILDDDIYIAGRVAKWVDTDGDVVTLTVSKGTLGVVDFDFSTANQYGGHTLNSFNIVNGGQQFLFADINIQATAQLGLPAGIAHDGLVNVGKIQSNTGNFGNLLELTGFDLGNVIVDGNLDQIVAGDLFNDIGLKSLQVASFGVAHPGLASAVIQGIGTIAVRGDFSGNLAVIGQNYGYIQSLGIAGALRGAGDATTGINTGVISTTGNIGVASIGSIVGGLGYGSASISAAVIGTLRIVGDIDNTGALGDKTITSDDGTSSTFYHTASVSATTIGTVNVGGSIIGGSLRAQNAIGSVTVAHDVKSAVGSAGTIAAQISAGGLSTALALRAITVHGNVDGARFLGGYQNSGQTLSGDAQIGTVQIDGNVRALDIVAGIQTGADNLFNGTLDTVIPFSSTATSSTINAVGAISRIAQVIIGGTVTGDGSSHGIEAQQVDSVFYQGVAIKLTGAVDTKDVGAGTGFQVREIAG